MIRIQPFTFNPFSENTYVLDDGSAGDSWIIDPGCFSASEQSALKAYVHSEGLKPSRLLLTHAHIDHILGNEWVCSEYGLQPEMHVKELPVFENAAGSAALFGVPYTAGPGPETFLDTSMKLTLGESEWELLDVPGHSPGSIAFVCHALGWVLGGDVLFQESIGRSDLPGGNHEQLIQSIREKLYTLPDHYRVFPGHGPETTIGHEKRNNPFVRA